MKRTAPLLITGISGLILFVSVFIPVMEGLGEDTAVWFDVLAAIAFILGGGNLLKVHLKKISDNAAGWGYSAVTIFAFLFTLYVGLFKIGVSPEASTEYFGQSFVSYPLEEMPTFSTPGTIPERTDGERLPASALRNLSEDNGVLTFRGWMSSAQRADLNEHDSHVAWRDAITALFEASQPTSLAGRISYNTDHESLSFVGYMDDAEFDNLVALLGDSERALAAARQLQTAARLGMTIRVPEPPPAVVEALTAVPVSGDDAGDGQGAVSDYLFFGPDQVDLTVYGPLTPSDQDNLANVWPKWERVRPVSGENAEATLAARAQLAEEFVRELETHGPELSDQQKEAVSDHFATVAEVQVMIDVIATAATEEGSPLNEVQANLVRNFAATPDMTWEQFQEASGFTPGMLAAAEGFMNSQPTLALFQRDAAFAILKQGTLSDEQKESLFADYRAEYDWKQAVDRLLHASHVTKFPWSGSHEQEGALFWWCYAYLFRPLVATMFAMLAFYVASAAFRAFRAKNIEALLLLGTAFIILLGHTSVGVAMTAWIPKNFSAFKIDEMSLYVSQIFMTAGNRAIMIGIALGVASTSLKVLLGVDRSYLGSGDD